MYSDEGASCRESGFVLTLLLYVDTTLVLSGVLFGIVAACVKERRPRALAIAAGCLLGAVLVTAAANALGLLGS